MPASGPAGGFQLYWRSTNYMVYIVNVSPLNLSTLLKINLKLILFLFLIVIKSFNSIEDQQDLKKKVSKNDIQTTTFNSIEDQQ